jgi:hypothetical protein
MARIINFYVPDSFHKRVKWIPAEQRGQVTEFRPVVKLPDPKISSELTLEEPA